jgi:hypothetical protein
VVDCEAIRCRWVLRRTESQLTQDMAVGLEDALDDFMSGLSDKVSSTM